MNYLFSLLLFLFLISNQAQACGGGICEQEPVTKDFSNFLSNCDRESSCAFELPYLDELNYQKRNISLISEIYAEYFQSELLIQKEPTATNPKSETKNTERLDFSDVRNSNNQENVAEEFLTAASKSLNPSSLSKLRELRMSGQVPDLNTIELKSKAESEFFGYLAAAADLYALKYNSAADSFCKLAKADDPWIKEASLYLCGRALLLHSQEYWDGYEDVQTSIENKNINPETAERADQAFLDYLAAFPNGKYSESALGLRRRAAYFSNNWEQYLETISSSLSQAIAKNNIEQISLISLEFKEYQYKFSKTLTLPTNPILATSIFLLRKGEDNMIEPWIKEHENKLSEFPGLRNFLEAKNLFRLKNHDAVLDLENADLPAKLTFAIESIKADSLEELEEWDDAIKKRKELFEQAKTLWPDSYNHEQMQLLTLRTYLKADRIEELLKLYEDVVPEWASIATIKSILPISKTIKICKEGSENKDTYRKTITDTACQTSITRLIYSSDFEQANTLLKHSSPEVAKIFSELSASLTDLSHNNPDPKSLLIFAEFVKNDYCKIQAHSIYTGNSPDTYLGSLLAIYKSELPKTLYNSLSPIQLLERTATLAKENGDRETEAKAISRFLNCFKVGNKYLNCARNSTSIHTQSDYPKEKRMELFRRLNKDLKDTEDSKKQKYWF